METRLRSALEAVASHWLPRIAWILFATLILATAALGLTQNIYNWMGETPPKGIASIEVWKMGMVIATAGTTTAFLATLYVAQRNYLQSIEHIPHLTMTLSVERVPVSMTYDVVVASLEAQNTGSGLCTVNEVNWMVVAVSPYDDETMNLLLEEFEGETDRSQEEEFPWYKVSERPVKVDLLIEPGETEQLTQEFVIKSEIESTITSAYVVNGSDPKLTDGWYRRALHRYPKELM